MKQLLLLVTLHGILLPSETINGVIWSKKQEAFVPIFSIQTYAMMERERFRQSRVLETHNFVLQTLTLTSFEDPNFFTFYDNDTKVSGLCGEIWTLLSESLNFTLKPIRINERNMGLLEKDGTYKHGLLGAIYRNETIAIPKVETYSMRLAAIDFTIPLWINSQRLHIHYKRTYDNTWMIKVFSWKVWCTILVMHVLISVCSFWSQNVFVRVENKYKSIPFGEHYFYSFGMLCNQSYIPEFPGRRSRILEVSLGLFSYIIYVAFSTLLFTCITRKVFIPPFDSLESLITETKYDVISLKDSIADLAFKVSANQEFIRVKTSKRTITASTSEEMFKMACFSLEKKYALFQGEDERKVRGRTVCHLDSIGKPYLKMWIASGIVKHFKYKRTIDLGILKLKEAGLLTILKDRWLAQETDANNEIDKLDAISIDQVSLVIGVMCCGVIIAFIILVIENMVFLYKFKQS